MSEQPAPVSIVRLADTRREASAICRLLETGFEEFSETTAQNKVSSQYLDNPSGVAECIVLEASGRTEIAGMQALVRRTFVAGNSRIPTGSFADFVVVPEHRLLGPALRILKHSLAHGKRTFDLLYGFPNEKAQLVFSRAGLLPTGRIVRYVKPIRSVPFLSARWKGQPTAVLRTVGALADAWLWWKERRLRAKGAVRWITMDTFDHSFDELWATSDLGGLLLADRSREQLAWRFGYEKDVRIAFCRQSSDDSPVGYVVWIRRPYAIRILDFLVAHPSDLALLLSSFVQYSRKAGADSIAVEFAGPDTLSDVIEAVGFISRDSAPYVTVRGERGVLDAEHLASLYLTSFDRDSI